MKHEKGLYIKIEITLPSVKWNPADVAAHCNCCLFPVTLIKLHCPCSKCRNQWLPIGHSMGQRAPAGKRLRAPPACPGNGADTQFPWMAPKINRLCSGRASGARAGFWEGLRSPLREIGPGVHPASLQLLCTSGLVLLLLPKAGIPQSCGATFTRPACLKAWPARHSIPSASLFSLHPGAEQRLEHLERPGVIPNPGDASPPAVLVLAEGLRCFAC